MIWDEIENYLFENYGIEEIYDEEIYRLVEKHDKEVRNKAIEEFYKMIENHTKIVGNTYLEDIREIAEQMKEVEGKKPITYSDTNRADCPTCGATVRGISKPFGKYCSHCGQKLAWGEEDE